MASTTYRRVGVFDRPPPSRRAAGFLAAIAINLLLLFLLLGIGASRAVRQLPAGSPLVITLTPDSAAPSPAPVVEPRPPTPERPIPPKLPPVPVPLVKLPTPPAARPLELIPLSKADYAASDIGKLAASADSGSGAKAGDSQPVGVAPNGEKMFRAEWVRHPTNAELNGYLPTHMPDAGGMGLIACRTIAHYHVDDCIELDQRPHGSHLASSVRQAAWQFLVRPPRINGKELVGTWVSIEIDYNTDNSEKSD